ncbi:hypothetical protein PCANC_18089 [Puccinia coronata f. sp. avenae]|uniref:Nucleoporin Nup159/Nup146 N-terminal domain-containing protein n=1 Tax=Puccinia coronata f. sp. avenae TaxID=200324 RepID=A0A2N5SLN5_9BASI|nr:hypothetical protein PCANC_18089 [Puccinia coronata f. sp. avenae]
MDVPSKDVEGTISLSPYRPSTYLRVSPPLAPLPKSHYSLFAISNVFGWAVVVISSPQDSVSSPAFLLARLDDLQTAIDQAEPYSTTPFDIQEQPQTLVVPIRPLCPDPSVFITHVSFAAWDRLVVVATSNGSLHIFSLHALITQKSTVPLRSIPSASNVPLNMLVPNPSHGGSLSGVIALVYQDGTIKVVDCYDTEKTYWTSQLVTAAEWSPMGKRLIVGYSDGRLEFITHDGVSKGKIDPPALVEKGGHSVLHIEWVDQKNYLVSFTPTTDQSEALNETYCLHVPKQSASPAYTFARVVDAINSDGDPSLSPKLLTAAISANPKTNWKYIVISSFTNSTSLTLVGYDQSDKPFFLDLEEGRPEIPVAEDDYSPSAPLGIAISFSIHEQIPLVWAYTTDGVLSLWKLLLSDPSLPADVKVWNQIPDFSDVSTLAQESMQEAPTPLSSEDVSASSHVVPQALASSQSSGFTNFASSSSVTAFGQPSLPNSQITSGPLSQTSAFGKPSGLGNPSTTATAFGQPSPFGNTTSSVLVSAFGNPSAFGNTTQPHSAQASPSGQPSAFGKPSTFGSFSSCTAFGTPSAQASPFGTSSATGNLAPATTTSAFGQSSAFGKPAFPGAPGPFSSSTAFGKSAFASTSVGATTSSHSASQTQPKLEGSNASSSTGFAAFANPSSKSELSASGGFAQFTNTNSHASFLSEDPAAPSTNIFENPPSAEEVNAQKSQSSNNSFSQLSSGTAKLVKEGAKPQDLSFLTNSTTTAPALSSFQGRATENDNPRPQSAGSGTSSPLSVASDDVDVAQKPSPPSTPPLGAITPLSLREYTPNVHIATRPHLKLPFSTSTSAFGQPSAFGKPAFPSASGSFSSSTAFGKSAFVSSSVGATTSAHSARQTQPKLEASTASSNTGFAAFANPSDKSQLTASGGFAQFTNTSSQASFLPRDTATPSASIFDNPPSAQAGNTKKPQSNNNSPSSHFSPGTAKSVKEVTRPQDLSFLENSTTRATALSSLRPRVAENDKGDDEDPRPQSAGSGPSSPLSVASEDVDVAQPSQILGAALDKSFAPLTLSVDAIDALSLGRSTSNINLATGPDRQASHESKPYLANSVRSVSFGFGGFTQPPPPRSSVFGSASFPPTVPASTPPTSAPPPNSILPPPTTSFTAPPPSSSKPPVEETKLPVEKAKPHVEEPQPSVKESKLSMEEAKPSVEKPKPPVEEPKPLVEEPKSPVEEPKAPVEKPKPLVEDPKPFLAPQRESEVLEPEEGLEVDSPGEETEVEALEEESDILTSEEESDQSSEEESDHLAPEEESDLSAAEEKPGVPAHEDEPEVTTPKEGPKVPAPEEEPDVVELKKESKVLAPEKKSRIIAPQEKSELPAPNDKSELSAAGEELSLQVPEEEPDVAAPEEPEPPKPPFLMTRQELIAPMTYLSPSNVPTITVNSTETFPEITGKELDEALLTITDSITSEIDCLTPVSLVCCRFWKECRRQLQTKPEIADLSQVQNWLFGDLPLLNEFVKGFAEHAKQRKAGYKARLQTLTAFESNTIKGDIKLDEIKRLWRLRNDPGFSKVIRSRQLGPVQLGHQKDMRRLIRDVKHGISQMSEVLQSFESRHREVKSCRNRMQTPSLDMINRCIRFITLGLTQYIMDLERMHLRICQSKADICTFQDTTDMAELQSNLAQKGSFRTPDQAAALRALLSEHRGVFLKDSILKNRAEPILTQARTLNPTDHTGEPHGLSHISATKTLVITPRQTTSARDSSLGMGLYDPARMQLK